MAKEKTASNGLYRGVRDLFFEQLRRIQDESITYKGEDSSYFAVLYVEVIF